MRQDSLQNKLFPLEYGLKRVLPSIKIKDSHIKKRILNGQKFNKMNLITKLKTKLYFLMMIQKSISNLYGTPTKRIQKLNQKSLIKGDRIYESHRSDYILYNLNSILQRMLQWHSGFFDGMHKGHDKVFDILNWNSWGTQFKKAVMTFDRIRLSCWILKKTNNLFNTTFR